MLTLPLTLSSIALSCVSCGVQEVVNGKECSYTLQDMEYVNSLTIEECEALIEKNKQKLKRREDLKLRVRTRTYSCLLAIKAVVYSLVGLLCCLAIQTAETS